MKVKGEAAVTGIAPLANQVDRTNRHKREIKVRAIDVESGEVIANLVVVPGDMLHTIFKKAAQRTFTRSGSDVLYERFDWEETE